MKSPDEIKKGLQQCCDTGVSCTGCPYDNDCHDPSSTVNVEMDAIEYINQLESRLAQVERERDAAVQIVHGLCLYCKNDDSEKCRKCLFWPFRVYFVSTETYVDHWEWRGVYEENTKEE